MKFLKKLLNSKAPSSKTLLDIAIVLSIIPHIMVMKSFMLLYLFLALIFLFKKDKRDSSKHLLMLIGLVLIILSFFTTYNFSDFSRMQFFVSLISSLLIYAVTLQRLSEEINVYLKMSPIFLMVLSFFFFNSISMLIYSVFTLFCFTLLYIWSRMDENLMSVIKFTLKLFIASTPLVAILFLVFPRISIEKTDFGFRADRYIESGYDGNMNINANELRLSKKVVMEVLFESENIDDSQLYFRGSTLVNQKGAQWLESINFQNFDTLLDVKKVMNYEITIYPHAKNWIYALDIPNKAVNNIKLNGDYTLSSQKPIYQKKKFRLSAALSYKLYSNRLKEALIFNKDKNKRTYKALKYIREEKISSKEKAYKLLDFFTKLKLSYTLKPTKKKSKDFTDSFLFETKNGYCVHYASAFANSARMLGIPSRIVTGFKAKKVNMIKNYLLVRASDAHAWVELYFKDEGWLRFDPTTTATMSLDANTNEVQNTALKRTPFDKVNQYFMYTKYILNNWILDYNRAKQMVILDKLLNDTIYLLKFILSFITLLIVTVVLFISIKSSRCQDKLMCQMQKLLKSLEKFGITKKTHQTMREFLQEAQEKLNISFAEIDRLYHSLKYKKEPKESDFKRLSHEIEEFYEESKSLRDS